MIHAYENSLHETPKDIFLLFKLAYMWLHWFEEIFDKDLGELSKATLRPLRLESDISTFVKTLCIFFYRKTCEIIFLGEEC